jgi:negative regulator of flagellin synthesis FlgM
MEITSLAAKLRAYQQKRTTDVKRRSSGENTARTETDQISVSSDGRLRGAAFSAALDAPEVRAAKVERLREEVRNGTFQPNLRKTAENLLRDDLDLLLDE